MRKYAYYPGCSAHSTGREYDLTSRQVFAALDVELTEIPDWNCCGASSAHSVSEHLNLALPGRNLAKAEKMGMDVIVPCAACFNRLAHAALLLPEMRGRESGLPEFAGKVKILNPMRVLAEEEMLTKLKQRAKKSLLGLKLVPYYGCLTVRPAEVTGVTGTELENPTPMDRILEELGAEIRSWSYKTVCCGAGQALPYPDITQKLSMNLVGGALDAGAEAIVTACPLCFVNLETQQLQAERIGVARKPVPVFYFTELMGIALGVSKVEATLNRHLIPVNETLASRSVL